MNTNKKKALISAVIVSILSVLWSYIIPEQTTRLIVSISVSVSVVLLVYYLMRNKNSEKTK
ncbi:hypothetical protein [Aneurinibacillus aneurinilyticus]|jgi:L-asparagine transporter-like permease|uniref:Uncharacterized protein n=1 Tax=Aneurinibacillus aneurinilyticus TaxID=1391 RepID=A0A848D2K8_ANEAE|nr:hypothetical protein [Aneurinibacillus aneurinilyticus]MED0668977.1 hypothetical protein [Aneurinibacillus aneurinilyticus]MED0709354.1 hypothetical protein [Aneurinibacillus aneurinilyticus]MED0726424.1 hypothetical protein [Aneurinibacillus aneurinilyticus]MED0735396.1 hypothetical protein [Aneurinibacillus aneurinilyticus]MED0742150.1 hypothetical protein [Aneurinibacillus aneurinilyticus]